MRVSKASIFIGVIVVLAIAAVVIAVLHISTTYFNKESDLGEAFTYDLEKFRKVDPDLIKYEEVGKIETKFENVFGITTDSNDRIYVAGDKAIRVFDVNGERLSELKLADTPRCLTVVDDENIYVGMKEHVEIYDYNGVRKVKWESLGPNAVLTSIAVSEDDVFVADAGNRIVLHYDTSGKLVNRIGKKDEDKNIPGFVIPSPYFDLGVAPDGLLRVANPGRLRVEAYTFDGYFELSWGEPSPSIEGFCGCCNPINFAMFEDGRFVTCEKGLPRVKIYDSQGVFDEVVAGPEFFVENRENCSPDDVSNCQTGGMDVALDSQGHILVLDLVEKSVRVFTRKI